MTLAFILLFVGAIAVFVETCIVGGVFGIFGVGCFAWSIWTAWTTAGALVGLSFFALAFLAILGAFLFWIYVIPHTRMGKKIYMDSVDSGKSPAPAFENLIGADGVASTEMLPSGRVEILGNFYDGKSHSGTRIAKGTKVKVIGADSFSLRVEPLE